MLSRGDGIRAGAGRPCACRGSADDVSCCAAFACRDLTRCREARKCLSRNEILDFLTVQQARWEGTSQVQHTTWSSGLSVTADGRGVIAHAGSVATRLLADRVGLTGELSRATARASFRPVHDRGRVLVDVAVLLADGGEAISDIDVLRHQQQVLGPVASAPTVWRALDELSPAMLKRVESARARVRRHVWSQLVAAGGVPPSRVADTDLGEVVVLDVDATLVTAHSEKQAASATFKGGFGYHPLGVWCDNTSEMLAAVLRPGNAGSNTTSDHIQVLAAAITQVPAAHRKRLLVRADGAGASHGLLDWLTDQDTKRGRSVEYPVGFAITGPVREAIAAVPKNVWTRPSTPTVTCVRAATSPRSPACST